MNLFEKLSDNEKTLMSNYIKWYAADGMAPVADLEYIMRLWNRQKEYLYHLFGNNFILEKEIEYKTPVGDMANEISRKIGQCEFYHSYCNFLGMIRAELSDDYWDICDGLHKIMSSDTLAKNKYEGRTFSINVSGTDKKITVQTGCKPIKILGKIAKEFNLKGYEDFRLMHSMALNQKIIKGTLCLSIHPLDYMTMSDNDSDWSSCMSWRDNGCYRQGTVEMMNSDNVIVAYIKSDNRTMTFSNGYEWNDKKWRELFICDDKLITGVKAYPYANYELTKIINDWIKELRITNNSYEKFSEYTEIFPSCRSDYSEATGISGDFWISFHTGNMYNDFGADVQHFGYLNINEFNRCKSDEYGEINVYYSGPSECMICGSEEPYFESEGYLACEDCIPCNYCDCCDEHIYDGDNSYEVDGNLLCEYCYDNYTIEDYHGEVHMRDNCVRIYLCTEDYSKIYYSLYIDVHYDEFYEYSATKCSKFLEKFFDTTKVKRAEPEYRDRNENYEYYIVPVSGIINNSYEEYGWNGTSKETLFNCIDIDLLDFTEYAKSSRWLLETNSSNLNYDFYLPEEERISLAMVE